MLKNLFTVGGWTMVSRILGLVRDQLLAILLGAGSAQDAYQVALRLPNMFRRFFGEGAFNAAFIPLFTEEWEKKGSKEALNFASEALATLLAFLVLFTIAAEMLMPWLVALIAPGFLHGDGTRFSFAVQFSRITMPYMTLICTAALVAGILNAREKFAAASIAYISFNIIGIFSILLGALLGKIYLPASDFFGKEILTARIGAFGIVLSGFVQLAALFWACRKSSLFLKAQLPFFSQRIKNLFHRILPGLIGSGVTQLNLTIDTIIATLLPVGSVSWLYFADRLTQLPLGILGAALGTTLLPSFSRLVANKKTEELVFHLSQAVHLSCFLILPTTFGMIAISPLLISGLFGYGHFQIFDVWQTSHVLRVYAIGLPAFVILKAITPVFFAQGNTATPVKVGFLAIIINLCVSIALFRPAGLLAPAIASDISAYFNLLVLCIILFRKRILDIPTIFKNQAQTFLLSLFIGGLVWAILLILGENLFTLHAAVRLFLLFGLILFSAIFYFTISWKLRLLPEELVSLIRRKTLSSSSSTL